MTWIKTCYKTVVIGCSFHTLSLHLMKSLPIKPGHSWIYTFLLSAPADIIHIPTLGTVYTGQPQISGQHPICTQYTISQKGQQLCSLVAIGCNKNSFHSMIYIASPEGSFSSSRPLYPFDAFYGTELFNNFHGATHNALVTCTQYVDKV